MKYVLRVLIKNNRKFLVRDNKETGKWELIGVETHKLKEADRLALLYQQLIDVGVSPIGLHKTYEDKSKSLRVSSDPEEIHNTMYGVDDYLGDKPSTKEWAWLEASKLLQLGNLDAFTRRYLDQRKTAGAEVILRKIASGPRDNHRSVSAVIIKAGKLFVMDHKYQKIWSIPKGHIDGDESAKEAILRELDEELGITVVPSDCKLLTWFSEKYKTGEDVATVKHYIYVVEKFTGTIKNRERAKYGDVKFRWVPLKDVPGLDGLSKMTYTAATYLRKRGAGFFTTAATFLLGAYGVGKVAPLFLPRVLDRQVDNLGKSIKKMNPFSTSDSTPLAQKGRGASGTVSDQANTFATETVPALADSAYTKANTFATETVPALADSAYTKVTNAPSAIADWWDD